MRPIRPLICLALLSLFSNAQAQDGLLQLKLTTSLAAPHTWHSGGSSSSSAGLTGSELVLSKPAAGTGNAGVVETLILAAADSMVGTRYRLGSDSESALDCSAFVRRAFGVAGLELPRSTREMIQLGEQIEESELAPGDLMFYRFNRGLHVALYAGNGEIVHASPTARQVVRAHLTEDWNRRLVAVRRVI